MLTVVEGRVMRRGYAMGFDKEAGDVDGLREEENSEEAEIRWDSTKHYFANLVKFRSKFFGHCIA